MRRSELAHILRAAATIAQDPEVVILGSQSILGTWDEDDLPDEAVGSVEADVAFWGPDGQLKADLVDGAIGEDSGFHQLNGYYPQGVGLEVAVLPDGWRGRVRVWSNLSSAPGRAHCLEPHDLAVAKLVAWREKDRDFVEALLDCRLLLPDVLLERLKHTSMPPPHRRRLTAWVTAVATRAATGD